MTANRIRLLRLSWAAASLTLALLAGLPSSARITADRNATTAANKSDELDFGVEREENCFAMCVARCRTFSRVSGALEIFCACAKFNIHIFRVFKNAEDTARSTDERRFV